MPLLYFQRAKRDHYFVNRVNSREDRCPENHELNLYPKGKALEHLFFFFLTLSSPGCPGTHSVEQASLKLRDALAPASKCWD